MEEAQPAIIHGLEGVYFTESKICKVDGTAGKLYYRGYSIETLAKNSSFEEVCYLLLYGKLPTRADFKEFNKIMKQERKLEKQILKIITNMAGKAHPMDVLRTAVSSLSAYDDKAYEHSKDANLIKSISIISKFGTITAAIARKLKDQKYITPKKSLGHAANILYMMNGTVPSEADAKTLDLMLILHAEHSSNASTFATLVTGATLADIYAAITSGCGALKGPLHGGADEAALKMMYAIGTPEKTEQYLDEALAGKQKIMGFGHRVYKEYDPRAKIIREKLEELQNSASPDVRNLTAIALTAEKIMIDKLGKTKGIWPNVDFFSGPVYTEIGIPPELFDTVFATSRVPGWCAHMIEYWENNRIIRPLEKYTGSLDLEYVPIGKR
jgi:citrate synthase